MASKESADVARRAKQFYTQTLRVKLEATNMNDYVAIEPDSGDYFLGNTLSAAIQASRAAHPNKLAYAMRIGHEAALHIGAMAP